MAVTQINEAVSVQLHIDAEHRVVVPYRIKWRGKVYPVLEVGKYWPSQPGRGRQHWFTVNVGSLDMCIRIDSFELSATLEYVSDGLAD